MIERLRRCASIVLAAFALAAGNPALANDWGVFSGMAEREWRTEGEPRPRISIYSWQTPGRVLVGLHGFESRRDLNPSDFADTTQRLTLDPKSSIIKVIYEYADGRAPLHATIRIESNGTATESFTDANGIPKRNVYTLPKDSVTLIEREELREGRWAALGQSRKLGMTASEIAAQKLREQQAAELAAAEARAQQARDEALKERMIARAEAEREEEEARQASQPNALQVLQGMAQQINQQNRDNQARFERQMAADIAEQKRQEAERVRQMEEQNRRIAADKARQEVLRQQASAQEKAAGVEAAAPGTGAVTSQIPPPVRKDSVAGTAATEAQRVQREQIEARKRAEAEAAAQKALIAKQQEDAERLRREQEAKRPVPWKEGVVLCKQQSTNSWRCDGPLQVDYGNVNDESGLRAARAACGGGSPRKLGMWSGFMAYGCGFGIHPTDRKYPGNRDIPGIYGVGMPPATRTFYCAKSVDAYCRNN